jgi:hypothetical protein
MTAVVAAAFLASGYHRWLGSSRVTFGEVADLGPVVCLVPAVVAGFLSSASRRRGEQAIIGVTVHQQRHTAAFMTGLSVAALLGVMLTATAALVTGSVVTGDWQFAGWMRLLPVLTACFTFTVLGSLIGGLLPWPPMAALLAPLGWFAYAISMQVPTLNSLQLYQGLWSPAQRLSPIFIALQTLGFAAVALLLQGLPYRGRRAVVSRWILIAVVAVCVGGLIGGGSRWITIDRHDATARCKIRDGVDLCLPASEEAMRGRLAGFVHEAVVAARVVNPSLADPRRTVFVANDVQAPDDHRRIIDVTSRFGPTFAMYPDRNDTLVQLLPDLINPHNCPYSDPRAPSDSNDTRQVPSTMGSIWIWQVRTLHLQAPGYGVPAPEDFRATPDSLAQRLQQASNADRTRWFRSNRAAIESCHNIGWS